MQSRGAWFIIAAGITSALGLCSIVGITRFQRALVKNSEDTPLMPYKPRSRDIMQAARTFARQLLGPAAVPTVGQEASANYTAVWVYTNLDPLGTLPTLSVPGWELSAVWSVALPIVYPGAPIRTYWYNAQFRNNDRNPLPSELTAYLQQGDVRSAVLTYCDPTTRPDLRLQIFSNYWRYHHPEFIPSGAPFGSMMSPRKWLWMGASYNASGKSSDLEGLELRPAPLVYRYERGQRPGHAASVVAAWLPSVSQPNIECVLRFRDGRRVSTRLGQGKTVQGVKFSWKLPPNILNQLTPGGI